MFTINLNYKSIYMMFFYFELFIIRVRSPHLAAPLDECLDLLRQSNYRVSQKRGILLKWPLLKSLRNGKSLGVLD